MIPDGPAFQQFTFRNKTPQFLIFCLALFLVFLAATAFADTTPMPGRYSLYITNNSSAAIAGRLHFVCNDGSSGWHTFTAPPNSRTCFDSYYYWTGYQNPIWQNFSSFENCYGPSGFSFSPGGVDPGYGNGHIYEFTALPPTQNPGPTSQIPGSGLKLWLKADSGVETDANGRVTRWQDFSGQGNNATAPSEEIRPALEAGSLNGKPAVVMEGDDYITFPRMTDIQTVFLVLKYDASYPSHQFLLGDGSNYDYHDSDEEIFWTGSGNPNVKNGVTRVNGTIVDPFLTKKPTTWALVSLDQIGPAVASNFSKDRWFAPFKGRIAEMLIYNRRLSDEERSQVEAALMLKYSLLLIAPSISVATGVYSEPQTIAITSPVEGATIRYTLDGSEPSENSEIYIEPLVLSSSATLKAALFKEGITDRQVATSEVIIDPTANFSRNGLQLWLSAECGLQTDTNGKVTTWQDISGQAHHAKAPSDAARPTLVANALNGKPIIRFSDSNDVLYGIQDPVMATGNFTMIVVSKRNVANPWTASPFSMAGTSGANGAPVMTWRNSGNEFGIMDVGRSESVGLYTDLGATGAGQFFVSTITRSGGTNGNGGQLRLTAEGQDIHNDVTSVQNWTSSQSGIYYVGQHYWQGFFFNGDIAEVFVYNRALSDEERSQIEAALMSKYRLPLMAPSISVATGVYSEPQTIAITSPVEGATIRYTLDGSEPSENSEIYIEPLVLSSSATLKAALFKEGITDRQVATSEVIIDPTADIPRDGLNLWLSSEYGITQDANSRLTSWKDISGKGNNAVAPSEAARPALLAGGLAGKPAVVMEGDDYITFPRMTDIRTVFEVMQYDPVLRPNQFLLGDDSTYYYHDHNDFIAGRAESAGYPTVWNGVTWINGIMVDPTTTIKPTSWSVISMAHAGNATASNFSKDRWFSPVKGKIAALLIYNRVLSDAEREQVEDYLTATFLPDSAAVFSLPSGLYNSSVTVSITAATPLVEFRYTTDGSEPTADSPLVPDGGVALSDTATLTVKGFRNGFAVTPSSAKRYIIKPEATFPLAGVKVWMKAEEGVENSSARTVDSWSDITETIPSAVPTSTPSSVKPSLVENALPNGSSVVRFDGVSQCLWVPTIPALHSPDGAISVFVFAKWTDGNDQGPLLATTKSNSWTDGGWGLGRFKADAATSDRFGFWSNNASTECASTDFPIGSYHLLSGVRSTTELQIFEDGQLSQSVPVSGAIIPSGQGLYFGGYSPSGKYLAADIAEVLIYDRALSSEELAQVHTYFTNRYGSSVVRPVAMPPPGLYDSSVSVNLTSLTPDAVVRYTLDGSDPGETSPEATGPVLINQGGVQTLKARAFVSGAAPSALFSGQYQIDDAAPVISGPRFDAMALTSGATVTAAGTLSIGASDLSGISRVEFLVNDQILGSSSVAVSGRYAMPWNISGAMGDGPYTLKFRIYDNLGKVTEEVIPVNLVLARPPAPVFTSPSNGIQVAAASVVLKGTAAQGATVSLYRGQSLVASGIPVNTSGQFEVNVPLEPGEQMFTAAASFRSGEQGTASGALTVTRDEAAPLSPLSFLTTSLSGGRIRLDWVASPSSNVKEYEIYRSTSPFEDIALAQKVGVTTSLSFTDTPPAGVVYYYRVVPVSGAGVSGTISTASSSLADSTPPSAQVLWTTETSPVDGETGAFGVGRIRARVVVSEKLQAAPFLSIQPEGGLPASISLIPDPTNPLVYSGQVEITGETPSGGAAIAFVGRDMAGNRGIEIEQGATVQLDTAPPSVVAANLPSAVKNNPANPAVLNIEVELNEPAVVNPSPALVYTLTASQTQAQTVVLSPVPDSGGLRWTAAISLPANAGADPEDLALSLVAKDSLGNEGGSFGVPSKIFVYQELPGLVPPVLTTAAGLGGAVELKWNSVEKASQYVLFSGSSANPEDLVELATVSASQTSFSHTPTSDGTYYFAIAARRTLNGEDSALVLSNPVPAVSDRVPPAAPENLVLSLSGQGIAATWEPPQAGDAGPLVYQLLRSSALPVTLEGGHLVRDRVSGVQTLDSSPTSAETHYVVVAVDAAGNRSQPSAPATLNADLYPPSTLEIFADLGGQWPVTLQWTQTGSAHSGHRVSRGEESSLELIGSVAAGTNSFSDAPYDGTSRRYVLETVDAEGNKSLQKVLHLPGVKVEALPGQSLGKGIINRLQFTVTNLSQETLANAVLNAEAAGDQYSSEPFSLSAGASTTVEILIPGHSSLPDSIADLDVALQVEPSPGMTATLTASLQFPVVEKPIQVTLHAHDLLRGGTGRASFTVGNPGAVPLEIILARGQGAQDSPDVRFRIRDLSGDQVAVLPVRLRLGENVTELADGTAVLEIPPGGTVTSPEFQIPVPLEAPADVAFSLEIDRMWFYAGSVDAVALPLSLVRTVNASTLEPPYTARVESVTPEASQGSEPVLVSGTATLRGGAGVAVGQPVAVTIIRDGYERTFQVVTDADGTFTYPFVLGEGESGGVFQVWAHHPDQTAVDPQKEFTIGRVIATPSAVNWSAPRNLTQTLSFRISTTGGNATNVHAALLAEDQDGGSLPAGISLQSATLASVSSSGTLDVTLQTDNTAPASGTLVLRLLSDETSPLGFQKIPIHYTLGEAKPSIAATPQFLDTGVNPGKTLTETITIKNGGLAPLVGATWEIAGASVPAWVTMVSSAALGQLDPGASAELRLNFAPPASSPEGDYYLKVIVRGANSGPLEFPLHVTVTSGQTGTFSLRVIDANTGGSLSEGLVGGVSGAHVRLQNARLSTVPLEGTTNENGEIGEEGAGWSNVPEGLYDLTITDSRHQPYRSSVWIRPGGTTTEQAVLQFELVSVAWEVVETTLQDSYQVVATVNWETNVNVPVLVATPAAINLPEMEEGEVYSTEISIRNYGLIAPDDARFTLPANDEFFRYEMLPNAHAVFAAGDSSTVLLTVPPGQEIRLPIKITALKNTRESQGTTADRSSKKSAPLFASLNTPASSSGSSSGCAYSAYCYGYANTRCPNGTTHNQNFSVGVFARRSCPIVLSSPAWLFSGHGSGGGGGGGGNWGPISQPTTDGCFTPIYVPPPKECRDPKKCECSQGGGGPSGAGPSGGGPSGGGPSGGGPSGGGPSGGGPSGGGPSGGGPGPSSSGQNSPASSWVDLINREYQDGKEDLSVPVPGGKIVLRRDFYGNDWHFAHEQKLTFVSSTDGSETVSILRHRVVYASVAGSRTYFSHDGYTIKKQVEGGVVTWLWKSPTGQWERFDEQGRIMENGVRGEKALVVYYAPGENHPSELRDADGRTVMTLHYTDGKLDSATDLAGRTVHYLWENGRLTRFTDSSNQPMTMAYDSEGRMTGKVDRNGQAITITYTSSGFVSGILGGEQGDLHYAFSYDASTRTHYARVTYATGRVVETWYDQDAELTKKAENGLTVLTRTRSARSFAETDALGYMTVKEYDSSGNLVRQEDPDGRIQSWEYEPVYQQLLRHTDARGIVTTYSYYPDTHLLHQEIRGYGTPQAQTTTYEWDAAGRLEKVTDPVGMVTKVTYYADSGLVHTTTSGFGTALARTTTNTYDEEGNLKTETDPLNRTTTYDYDELGRQRKVTNALGEETLYEYTGTRLTRVETGRKAGQPGRAIRRSYDGLGRLVAEYQVGTDGSEILSRGMTYDADGHLLTETNALGQVVQRFTYDLFGRETSRSVPNSLGGWATESTEYDEIGRIAATVSAEGLRKEFFYDLGNRPVRIKEASGTALERVTERVYDNRGDLVEERFPTAEGTLVTQYASDALGRRVSVSGDRADTVSLTYDGRDHILASTDGRGNTTVFAYDILGREITRTLPVVPNAPAAVITSGYDAADNLVSQQDGDGRTVGFACDALNRWIARSVPVQGALSASWKDQPSLVAEKTVYNALGDISSVSAPAAAVASGLAEDANRTEIHYDAHGRAIERIVHTGPGKTASTTMLHSLVGQQLSSTTTGAGTTVWEYDPANPSLVRSVTEPSGLQTVYAYDAANRRISAVRSSGGSESWQYDGLGRVGQHTVAAPDAATQVSGFEYDRFDQPTFLTLPGSTAQAPRTETRSYDGKGRLATQSGPGVYALAYDYDESGNLVWMSDANGSETTWVYDARNQMAEKHYADGTVWTFTRDAAGNVKTRKDAKNQTTTYAYNAFRRVAGIDYPNDHDVAFSYDGAGRLTGMTDGTGASTWTPDAWNRMAGSSQPLTGRSLTYAYNALGQRESLAITGGRGILYQYDSLARLRSLADSVTGGAFVYSYQPGTNWVSQIVTPSGSATVMQRDSLGRILDTAFLRADNQTLGSFTYGYDAAGQRATEESPRGNIAFSYDGIGELTAASGLGGGNYAYQYDGIGNRLTATGPGFATTYTPNALNQYTSINSSVPVYDFNGSLTNDGAGTTLGYDDENRLITIVKGTKRSEFVYDGLSRRVETRELEGGTVVKTIRYGYDGLLPVEELEWSGVASGEPTRTRQITRGPDLSGSWEGAGGIGGLLAFTTNGASAWYFADGNGNVTNLFTPADTTAASYTYDAFGRRLSATGTLANVNTFQWSGKECHEASGLVYYLYRYYNPVLGRWASRDPIGEAGGLNLYGFVGNDPQRLLDCWGNSPIPGDYLTSDEFYGLSSKDKDNWTKAFVERFGASINQSAKDNCVPKALLALIIANEMSDWRWPDGQALDGILGGGVGPAQISPTTAVQAGVTGMSDASFSPFTVYYATSTGSYYPVQKSARSQHIEATRRLLHQDASSVSIAAKLLKTYMNELCCKDKVIGGGARSRFIFLQKSSIEGFCKASEKCETIVNLRLPIGAADAFAAKWNTPDVWGARDPIGEHNYPNANINGLNADMMQDLLNKIAY